ncbi:MAG: LytTR family DNA-binding domain-containing protein [Bacteroidales bacterium]
MKGRVSLLLQMLNRELVLYLGISLGVMMFALVFHPFPMDQMDLDDSIMFVSGLGLIIFFSIMITRVVCPCFIMKRHQYNPNETARSMMSSFMIWLVITILFAGYLELSVNIDFSTFLLFRIVILGLGISLILRFYDELFLLRRQHERHLRLQQIRSNPADIMNNPDADEAKVFFSENKSDRILLKASDLLFIRSADNYVEFYYKDNAGVNKKLLRNTLSNIEMQVNDFPELIRCHRTCIVNISHIERSVGNCNKYNLQIKDYNIPVPVSRQYFSKINKVL